MTLPEWVISSRVTNWCFSTSPTTPFIRRISRGELSLINWKVSLFLKTYRFLGFIHLYFPIIVIIPCSQTVPNVYSRRPLRWPLVSFDMLQSCLWLLSASAQTISQAQFLLSQAPNMELAISSREYWFFSWKWHIETTIYAE